MNDDLKATSMKGNCGPQATPTSLRLTQSGQVEALAQGRLQAAKFAYTTRRVAHDAAKTLLSGDLQPAVGDLVLAQVTQIWQHGRLELATGRRATLYPGDEIVVCYGHRYAPDQYEARVPADLGPCHLVAAGGIASQAQSWHKNKKPPTEIKPLGLLGDAAGRRINLAHWGLQQPAQALADTPVLAVVGTAMNAGKTTAAAALIKGLARAGYRVGGAKITGTGSGGDVWLMQDAGADTVVDFTDAGHASTFGITGDELETIFNTLTGHLQQAGAEVMVLEVADGLLQSETAQLLSAPWFRNAVDGVLFAAADAMGASAGVQWLRQRQLNVMALCGTLSASPLASREANQITNLSILRSQDMSDKDMAQELMPALEAQPNLAVAS